MHKELYKFVPYITDRQAEYLEIINSFFRKNLRPPTFREVQNVMGLKSPASVSKMKMRLIGKGFLKETCGQQGCALVPIGIKIKFENGGCFIFWDE